MRRPCAAVLIYLKSLRNGRASPALASLSKLHFASLRFAYSKACSALSSTPLRCFFREALFGDLLALSLLYHFPAILSSYCLI